LREKKAAALEQQVLVAFFVRQQFPEGSLTIANPAKWGGEQFRAFLVKKNRGNSLSSVGERLFFSMSGW